MNDRIPKGALPAAAAQGLPYVGRFRGYIERFALPRLSAAALAPEDAETFEGLGPRPV